MKNAHDYELWFKIVLNATFTLYFFMANFVCLFLFAYYYLFFEL